MQRSRFLAVFTAVFMGTVFSVLISSAHADASIEFPVSQVRLDRSQPASYSAAVERASPSVVSIHTTTEIATSDHPLMRDPFFQHFFGPDMPGSRPRTDTRPGLGSGVIVHADGYVLTNYHVIQEADEITVTLNDGSTSVATVVGVDQESDIAVLRLPQKNLTAIELGDSEDLLVGDVVLAIGNPYGVGKTVTQGIVSARDRKNLGINAFENFIQTDAAINPGNSGGALINTEGQLIGINTAILSSVGANQGIGFATPINLARDIMIQLVTDGHVIRGWLGITVQPLSKELKENLGFNGQEGTVVTGVLRGGPAQSAGIVPGDIIVSLNEVPTPTPADLIEITAKLEVSHSYPIAIARQGEVYDYRVKIEQRPNRQQP